MSEYSLVRYWRYIFAPLVLAVIAFGWYILFNLSTFQLTVGALPPADSFPKPYTTP